MMQTKIQFLEVEIRKLNWNTEQPNEFSGKLLKMLKSGLISLNFYKKIFNIIQEIWPKEVKVAASYRMDYRSLGQMAGDFYEQAVRERKYAKYWIKTHSKKHFGVNVKGSCVGIDDSGKLIFETPAYTREDFKHPDYILSPINRLLELKSNDVCSFKATYKVTDIRHYVKCNAYMLTIFHEGSKDNPVCYTLISPNVMKDMLSKSKIEDRKEMGWKPSIQFYVIRKKIGGNTIGLSENKIKDMRTSNSIIKKALNLESFAKIYKY